jgi:hypothetical protein
LKKKNKKREKKLPIQSTTKNMWQIWLLSEKEKVLILKKEEGAHTKSQFSLFPLGKDKLNN